MAEHFEGLHHTIHFSNAGGEALLNGLIGLSNKIESAESVKRVREFFIEQNAIGDGGRSFSLTRGDFFPELFEDTESLKVFLKLLNSFCLELMKTAPQLDGGGEWGKDLRMSWLAKVGSIQKIVISLIGQEDILEWESQLSPEDLKHYQFFSNMDHFNELAKHSPEIEKHENAIHLKLEYLNEIISYVESNLDKSILLVYLYERVELLVQLGKKEKAIADLEKSLGLIEEQKEKEIVTNYIVFLKK